MVWMTALLFTGLGCSNSGLGRTTPTPTADSGSTTSTTPSACPIPGTWDLVRVDCSSFAFDDWFDMYESARLDVVDAIDGRGCDVSRIIQGETCRETERMRWEFDASGTVTVSSDGVTTCAPSGCSFPMVGTCTDGARKGTNDSLQAIVFDDRGELELTDEQPGGTFVAGALGCKLDVVTVWARR